MTFVEEMEGKPRPTPGLMQTIESVMSIVRQSREADGAPAAAAGRQKAVEVQELVDLFRTDLAPTADNTERRASLTPEQQEAEDLARIRAALYSV